MVKGGIKDRDGRTSRLRVVNHDGIARDGGKGGGIYPREGGAGLPRGPATARVSHGYEVTDVGHGGAVEARGAETRKGGERRKHVGHKIRLV